MLSAEICPCRAFSFVNDGRPRANRRSSIAPSPWTSRFEAPEDHLSAKPSDRQIRGWGEEEWGTEYWVTRWLMLCVMPEEKVAIRARRVIKRGQSTILDSLEPPIVWRVRLPSLVLFRAGACSVEICFPQFWLSKPCEQNYSQLDVWQWVCRQCLGVFARQRPSLPESEFEAVPLTTFCSATLPAKSECSSSAITINIHLLGPCVDRSIAEHEECRLERSWILSGH
jgi:hypothetical protein